MARKKIKRGVEPPIKSGHAVLRIGDKRYPCIFWIKLGRQTINAIERDDSAIVSITLPTGEEITKKVLKATYFKEIK